jgi:hypothetical protein
MIMNVEVFSFHCGSGELTTLKQLFDDDVPGCGWTVDISDAFGFNGLHISP